jgi:TolB-like protein
MNRQGSSDARECGDIGATAGRDRAPSRADGEAGGASRLSATEHDDLAPNEVRDQLQRILDSPAFQASERRKRFLRYVVEEALAGRAGRLKGYSIATAVFERDDSFDPQTDPVVRLEARRLRRALEHYYLTAGRDDPVRIEIPKGGYAPICERQLGAPPEGGAAAAADPGSQAQRFPLSGPAKLRSESLPVAGLAVALGAMLAVAAVAWFWWIQAHSDGSAALAAASPHPAAPAVIVLPFVDLAGSAADDRFAEGLTEEFISDLTRFEDLRVYALDDQQGLFDPAALGEGAEARYLVRGSVRRTAAATRMTAHLIDIHSGRYLWSGSYDRASDSGGPVALQKALGAELATRLAEPHGVVRQVTAGLLGQDRPEILRTYDCVSQAYAYRRTFNRDHYLSARDCLEEAVRRDASRPDAWALLAFADLDEYRWYGFGPRYRDPEALDQALAAAQRAMELDRDDVLSLSAYAAVEFYRGAVDEAEAAQRRAVALNPNNPELLAQLGWRIAFTRDWDQGIEMVRQAIERSHATDGWYFLHLAFDDYRRGDCRAALADLARMGGTFFFISPALVAMCQAELGNYAAAQRALKEASALDPNFAKDPGGAFRLHLVPESLIDRFVEGLRKAGLEGPGA